MSGKIEIGARVKVTHKPEHDNSPMCRIGRDRRLASGSIGEVQEIDPDGDVLVFLEALGGTWWRPDELTPVEPVENAVDLRAELQAVRANNDELFAMLRAERADHSSTRAAHQEAERLLDEARQARVEAERRENEAIADREHVEATAVLVRADLEALQAAVRGLTGREGNVAAMIGDLAHVGRVFEDVPSLRADLQAARDTLSKVSAAVDAVRLAWEGEAAENMIAALDAVDRALRGVPAPATEPRQCEACTAANGTATFHAPEEPCDPRPDLGVEERLQRLEAALREQGDRLGLLSAAVESISVHGEALDQRVAGIGNGLDEVRDPEWFRGMLAATIERAATTASEVETDPRTRLHEGDPAKVNPFEVREPPAWAPAFLERFGAVVKQSVDPISYVPRIEATITRGSVEEARAALAGRIGADWPIVVAKSLTYPCPGCDCFVRAEPCGPNCQANIRPIPQTLGRQ